MLHEELLQFNLGWAKMAQQMINHVVFGELINNLSSNSSSALRGIELAKQNVPNIIPKVK